MSTDPDQIRQDIDRTRENLGDDVDALAYKASPRRMVEERKQRGRHALRQVTDKIMGTPTQMRRRTEGNPLAAGLIAFAAGWLVSSLLPASRREQEAAGQVKTAVQEQAEAIKDEVGGAAQDMRDNLREPAQDAARSVRSTAGDAVQTVKEEARSATDRVKDEGRDARDEIRS